SRLRRVQLARGAADRLVADRLQIALAGADAHGGVEVADPDLAVADLAGASRVHDGVDDRLGLLWRGDDLELHFRQQFHFVLSAAIDFRLALLAAIAAHFGDGHAGAADALHGVQHLVELARLDDGSDQFHRTSPGPDTGGPGRVPRQYCLSHLHKRCSDTVR